MEQLLGAANGGLHLGLHQTFGSEGGGANEFRPGYFAVVLADAAKQVKPASLWVKDDRLHVGAPADELRPLTASPTCSSASKSEPTATTGRG